MGLIKKMNNFKISTKLSMLAIAVILIFLIVVSSSMIIIIKTVLGDYINDEIKIKSDVLAQNVEIMKQKSLAATEWFSSSPRLIKAIKSGNRQAAIDTGKLAMRSMGFDYMLVTDNAGNVFFRAHSPEKYGDNIAKQVGIDQ